MKTRFFCVGPKDSLRWRVNGTRPSLVAVEIDINPLPSDALHYLTILNKPEYNSTDVACGVQGEGGDWRVERDFFLLIRGIHIVVHVQKYISYYLIRNSSVRK